MRIEGLIKQYEHNYKLVRLCNFIFLGLDLAAVIIIGSIILEQIYAAVLIDWQHKIMLSMTIMIIFALIGWLLPVNKKGIIAQSDLNLGYESSLITLFQLFEDESEHVFQELLYRQVKQHANKISNIQPFQMAVRNHVAILVIIVIIILLLNLVPSIITFKDGPTFLSSVNDYSVPEEEHPYELFRETLARNADRRNLIDMDVVEFEAGFFENSLTEPGQNPDELQQRLLVELETNQEVLRQRLGLDDNRERMINADTDDSDLIGRDNANGQASQDGTLESQLGSQRLTRQDDNLIEGETLEGGHAGGIGVDEDYLDSNPDLSDSSVPGAGSSQDDDGNQLGEYQYSELEYEQQRVRATVMDDAYISAYLDELLPPLYGVQDHQLLSERLVDYRTDLLNQLANEQIPLGYREIIREYFSLLVLE